MTFLYKAKNYLRAVAEELGIEVTEKMIKPQIIKAIMESEHFEEQLVLNMLEEEEEKRKEELKGKRRKEALEEERRKHEVEEMRKLKIGEEESR
ncbi:hypothetical protein AVEN_64704-1 [Araneus ventricosus]|uniref:Uncharacterized protein n=1 Tax=Araneus ventricosus TaxID=182803 RepID=A0A4Y2Q8D2_ARAVE|nr:hypothetical protein AVEN_64704-1 [Araneus ventricosus]